MVWALDSFSVILRHLHDYFHPDSLDTDANDPNLKSPLGLMFQNAAKKTMLKLLHVIKLYMLNLNVYIKDPKITVPDLNAYFTCLKTTLRYRRPRPDALANFLLRIPSITNEDILASLYWDAKFPPRKQLDLLRPLYDSEMPKKICWPKSIPKPENYSSVNSLDEIQLFSTVGNINDVDVVTKQALGSSGLLDCDRCGSQKNSGAPRESEQLSFLADYKTKPPWSGSCDSYCICGGSWIYGL